MDVWFELENTIYIILKIIQIPEVLFLFIKLSIKWMQNMKVPTKINCFIYL